MKTPFSLNEIRERFGTRDIEITCTKTIKADVSICHGSDENGVRHDLGVSVSLWLPIDDEEHHYEYTFYLDRPGGRPLTLDDAAIALSIHPDEKVWKEDEDFDSMTEDYKS